MGPYELLRSIVLVLERLQIPYIVTGSIASMAYGEPRLTNDIDVVAGVEEKHIGGLLEAFPPEDVIIKKMEYYKEGGSEKHLRDITGILKISGDDLNYDYISEWAERLGLSEIWQAIKDRINRMI